MSNLIVISAVSLLLKKLLAMRIEDIIRGAFQGETTASNFSPGFTDINNGNKINLYLYRITPNLVDINEGTPYHQALGEKKAKVHLSVDLHYIITAYGKDELYAQMLLGYGMQVFYDYSVLGKDLIRRIMAHDSSSQVSSEYIYSLTGFVKQLKIVPEALSIEDLTSLWTAFGAPLRPSFTFKVSVAV